MKKRNLYQRWIYYSLILVVSVVLIGNNTANAQSCTPPAYNLDQGQNGNASNPTNPVAWANGNLNGQQAHYVEGYSVPYRAIITNLVAGQCYCIRIEYDIIQSDVNALDYLTSFPNCSNTLCDDPSHVGSFQHTAECVDPLLGVVGLGSAPVTYYDIPQPTNNVLALGELQPLSSFLNKPAADRRFTMYNGTLTSAVYDVQGDLLGTGNQATSMIVCFTAEGSTAVLAWGGHIASRLEWGVGNSASSISGSPYHMRILGAKCCNGTTFQGGNQDRSLQAAAVIPAPIAIITGTDSSCVGGTNNHLLTTTQPTQSTYQWVISDAGTTGAQIVGSDTTQSIEVTTTGPGEYIVCGTITINGVSGSTCDTVTVFGLPSCSITGDSLVCGSNSATFTASGGDSYLWSTGETTQSINVDQTGIYTVTVTDSFGCSSTCDKGLTAGTHFTLDTDVTDVFCKGESTGSIILNVIGGDANMTYEWSNGASTKDISGLTAGTYTVTVTDVNGCSATTSAVVDEPAAVLAANAVATDVLCNGGNTGSIDLTVSGGSAPYTYDWNNGSTDEDPQSLASGNYNVVVTDFFGCTAEANSFVDEPDALDIDGDVTNVACNGGNDGAIQITVTGGSSPYSYEWSTGSLLEDLTDLTSGTYTVTVTDANQCSATETFNVSQAGSLSMQKSDTDVSCNGGSDGTITISVSGGTPGYTYLWSDNSTDDNRTGLSAGTYTVTVTDNNGCELVESFQISEPAQLTIGVQSGNVSCNDGNDGFITLTINGGTAPYSFDWNNGFSDLEDLEELEAGIYDVVVTDDNGCTATESVNISEPALLEISDSTITDVSCFEGSNGGIDITVIGGTTDYIFSWNNGEDTEDLNSVGAGFYTVNIMDANGCTATAAFEVEEPSLLEANKSNTDPLCNGDDNGTISVTVTGGTEPYSYIWSNGELTEDVSGLEPGTYTITVTDANGCTATQSAVITEPDTLSVMAQITDVLCNGNSTGGVNIGVMGGVPDYSFNWSNGAIIEDISGLTAGTYTVVITDENGCTFTETFQVDEPTALSIQGSVTNSLCGGASGEVDITVTGGVADYSFLWSNSETTEDVTDLAAGTYTVTVTDENGCTAVESFQVTDAGAVVANAIGTDATCYEGTNGSADLTVTGGTEPYTFAWSNGQTVEDASGLAAGTYTVTVTDDNGCIGGTTVTIGEPAQLMLSIDPVHVLCNGGNNGSLDLTVTGGTGDYSYEWSNAETTEDIGGLAAGTYTVTVTDDNGCTATALETVTEPSALSFGTQAVHVLCNGASTGSIDLTVTGGTGDYGYNWSNGETTEDIGGLAAGTYTVTVTDENGCTATASETINEPTALSIQGSVTNSLCGGASGEVDITVTGGVADYSFLWSNSETTEDVTDLAAGTYTVTVTDENGCTAVESFQVTDAGAVVANAIGTDATCYEGNNGSADLTVTGGTEPYTFAWSNGQTVEDASGLAAGTYTVTVTDYNGCTAVETVNIGEAPQIMVEATGYCSPCKKRGEAYAEVMYSGGTGDLSVLWSTGATTATISNLNSGTYTVTLTDENGCSVTDVVILDCDPKCQYTTFTIGGYGSEPSGNNPGTYVHANFTAAFPNGLTIGCTNTLSLTSAQAVTDFLPSGSTSSALPAGALVNPGSGYNNVLAAQLVAVTLSTTFDAYDPNFSGEPGVLGDLEIASGTFAGWTVAQLLDSANSFIGGCGSLYSASQFNGALTGVNEAFNGGNGNTGFLLCPSEELTAFISHTDVSCDKVCDGTATVYASLGTAPYTYLWSNGETSATITGLCAGTYVVTVTDANECELTLEVEIGDKGSPITLDFDVTNNACAEDANGVIDLTVNGGIGPFTFVWSNGESSEDISNLVAGTYTVTVTDKNGCTASGSATLTDPDPLDGSFDVTHVSCSKKDDGAIDLSVVGGTQPYSFIWSTGEITEDISDLPAGTYTVTITDANDCVLTLTVDVNEISSEIVTSFDVTHNVCFGGSTGAIDLTVSGGVGPYTFLWSNGAMSEDVSGLTAVSYSVIVTDANGCSTTGLTYVNDGPAITATFVKTNTVCGINGALNLTVNGGTSPYSFVWSNGAITEDISGLTPGAYTVTITDANGCSLQRTKTLYGAKAMRVRVLSVTHASDNVCDGAIDIKVFGGTNPKTYQWSNGEVTEDVTNLCPGAYKVTVTDAQGCTVKRVMRVRYLKDVNPVKLEAPEAIATGISFYNLYPNPASESVNLRMLFNEAGEAEINVYNMIGKTLITESGVAVEPGVVMEAQLDINELPAGMYLVSITQNGTIVHQKLQVIK